MEAVQVKVLSSSSNNWVIQTPGRKYPGVVVQGDSLYHLHYLASRLRTLLADDATEEVQDLADELHGLLQGRVAHYDAALRASGMEPPQWGNASA